MTKKTQDGAVSPLMKQYHEIKAQHPDATLLFRVGDFYETFGQDAVRTSKALNIVLTSRSSGYMNDLELAGFPHHSLDTYLPRLVREVGKVAVCEQLEDPKTAKTIVKRGVTEVLTPGVLLSEKMLDAGKNNFLCALHFSGDRVGVAFLDISTGEFYAGEGDTQTIRNLIDRYQPSEIILDRQSILLYEKSFGDVRISITPLEDWVFRGNYASDLLRKHFSTVSLKGFGIDDLPTGVIAAGAVMHYLAQTKHDMLGQVTEISRIVDSNFLWIDGLTARNLNLFEPQETSLYAILNKTETPMGARLLRRFMQFPLYDIARIEERYNYVDFWLQNSDTAEKLSEMFSGMGDLERLASKIATLRATPREMGHLAKVLETIGKIQTFSCGELFDKWTQKLNPCAVLGNKIKKIIADDPASSPQKGKVIAEGVSAELDNIYRVTFSGKEYLADLQKREAERTGISSLKLGFNNVYGYYLEVTNVHKDKVPAEWIRKQTTTNAERYITEELKEYEHTVLTAQEKSVALQEEIYKKLLLDAQEYVKDLQQNARNVAFMDVMMAFSIVSATNGYVRAEIADEAGEAFISIENGRHPIIEKFLPSGEEFIPNNILLDGKEQQILMITGPNMSGKSAVLRQTALIAYMAQIGCHVSASRVRMTLVDKIFTRVGASDNLAAGESTFMTEMNEAAGILNNITSRSLVLLDEIGRGTSTYDGISIAWAIAEYLHENARRRPLVLFATHYHELNEMASTFERIKNYHISTREAEGRIFFLRKLVSGGSEHSFGIHVARMAGLPAAITERAAEMLGTMEAKNRGGDSAKPLSALNVSKIPLSASPATSALPATSATSASPASPATPATSASPATSATSASPASSATSASPATSASSASPANYQLSLFQLTEIDDNLRRIKEELTSIDLNSLTPLEALNKLNEIKKLL
ncbi:MAG: DNA mismatch repair protein MutS [Bacteroidales bacterium]|jgi:DNA mismatch repair protein MutS|nr:DNA mismatch repair protein MutS [Bacteroidales bacterium]